MSFATRVALVCLLLAPIAVSAQTTSGPLTVERVHTPVVIAPDYKITDLNGTTGQLAGAYGGSVIDDVLFIGGAGYWLANGSRGEELGYGGLLVGWVSPQWSGIRFGARGLVGAGAATLGRDVRVARPVRFGAPAAGTVRVLARDDFFVFEPQADATFKLFPHTALSVGGGYRFTSLADALDGRLDGVTGSVGVQFQW